MFHAGTGARLLKFVVTSMVVSIWFGFLVPRWVIERCGREITYYQDTLADTLRPSPCDLYILLAIPCRRRSLAWACRDRCRGIVLQRSRRR